MTHGWIIGGIGFVVGLISGAVGFGSLCTREARARIKKLSEQNDEMAEEIESLKAELRKKKESKVEKKENEMKSYREYKKLVEESAYRPKPTDPDDDEIDLKTVVDETEEEGWKDKAIYIIDKEKYKNDMNTRQTEALMFYREDGILVDITDDRIRGEAGLIGSEALEKLSDENYDEKFLYVSNDIEDVMYEIEINTTDSYYRDVLGMEA